MGVCFVLGNKGSPIWEDEIWTEAWTKRRGSIQSTILLYLTQEEQQELMPEGGCGRGCQFVSAFRTSSLSK